MSRRLTRRERANGRTKGPSPSGHTTPGDVALSTEHKAAQEGRMAAHEERNRVAVQHVPARPSTRQLFTMFSLLAGRGF